MDFKSKPVLEKIQKIALECREAGASEWETAKIIKALHEEDSTPRKLRKKAIELLKKINPTAGEVMESFTKMQVFTSKEWLESFDRGNIIKSLLKETSVSRTIAEKIGFEVENQLKDLKVNTITTAIIREMVAVKLLEYGHEKIHSQYTRLGLPVFEASKAIEKGKTSTQFVFRELNWLKKIPLKTRKLHFQGKIFLHFPQDFSSKIFGLNFFPNLKDSTKKNFLTNTLIEFNKKNFYSSIPPTINSLNFILARFLKKPSKETLKNLLKQIQCNQMNIEKRFTPVISLDYYSNSKEFDELKEKAIDIGVQLNSINQKSIKLINKIDSEYKVKLFEKQKKLSFLNCKKQELNPITSFLATNKKGVINFIELNMPFIALESNGRENQFNELLTELIETVNETNDKKTSILSKTDYFKQKDLNEYNNIIGLWGLKETEKIIGVTNLKEKIKKQVNNNTIITANNSVRGNNKFVKALEKEFEFKEKIKFTSGTKTMNQKEFIKKFNESKFISLLNQ